MYDYLIVGSGLCGAVIARELTNAGKKCIVFEKRDKIGGNLRCEKIEGIDVHLYGAHIFRTNDDEVWEYVNKYTKFNNFINSPLANYKGKIYNLPFNMNTFNKMWGVVFPDEAKKKIEESRIKCDEPKNLEEYILDKVGSDIYETLIKGYTEKQWGRSCKELDKSVMRRIPLRFTYDNNYYNAKYQGIPIDGYNAFIEKLLDGIDVVKSINIKNDEALKKIANKIIYTGPIDEFYDNCYGVLEYRSLKFEHIVLDEENHQGNAVVNYTDKDTPYTRIIEHKHFTGVESPKTVITKEYPAKWTEGLEKYYPIENKENMDLYEKYKERAKQDDIVLAGRLAEYKYYDMSDTIKSALNVAKRELEVMK